MSAIIHDRTLVTTFTSHGKRNRYEIDKINYKRWERREESEREKKRDRKDRIELPADANKWANLLFILCVYLPRVYHVQEPSFQQRVQLDPIDRAKQPDGATTAIARIPQCIGAIPMPRLRRHWRRGVSSYLSVAGEATSSGGGHKDPKRVVPPAGGWEYHGDDDGGWRRWDPRSARMPKLPLKHDARTPSQTARLQLTPNSPLPSSFSRGWPASSKSPYRASDSGTRSIILDMATPILALALT